MLGQICYNIEADKHQHVHGKNKIGKGQFKN